MAGPAPSTGRYSAEAAQFITEALTRAAVLYEKHTEQTGNRHLTAQQLLDGVVDLAAERWGTLADQVLRDLGIHTSDDIGGITFQLIADGVFAKQPEDRIEDFRGGPLAAALDLRYRRRLGLDAPS